MELQQNLVSTSAASATSVVDDDDEDEEVYSQGKKVTVVVVGKLACPIGGCSHGEFRKAVCFAKHILQHHYNYGDIKKGK